jgi:hypothetical protein
MSESRRRRRSDLYEEKSATSRAALSHRDVAEINKSVAKIVKAYWAAGNFSAKEVEVWKLMASVLEETKNIQSSDLPTDAEENDALVRLVHWDADYILGQTDINPASRKDKIAALEAARQASQLEKIIKIAALSQDLRAGNCQEKAFYGFYRLLNKLIEAGITTVNKTLPLELAYFSNHFVVLVDNRFLLDPWLNLVFPLSSDRKEINVVFKGFGYLQSYFQIDEQWRCFVEPAFGKNMEYDSRSTGYTFALFPTIQALEQPEVPSLNRSSTFVQTVLAAQIDASPSLPVLPLTPSMTSFTLFGEGSVPAANTSQGPAEEKKEEESKEKQSTNKRSRFVE